MFPWKQHACSSQAQQSAWYSQKGKCQFRRPSRGVRRCQPSLEILESRILLSTNIIGLDEVTSGTIGGGSMSIVSIDPTSNPPDVTTLLPGWRDYGLGIALTVERNGDIDFSAIPNASANPGPYNLFRLNPGTGDVTLLNSHGFIALATAPDGKVIGADDLGNVVSIDPGNHDEMTTLLPASAAYSDISALTVEANGNIDFVGSPSVGPGQLFRFNLATGKVTLLNSNQFVALATAPDGNVIAMQTDANYDFRGIVSIDPSSNPVRVNTLLTDPSSFVPYGRAGLTVEADGHIDFCLEIVHDTLLDEAFGLYRLDPVKGGVTPVETEIVPVSGDKQFYFPALASPPLPATAMVLPTAVQWDTRLGGVDVSYQVSGGALSQDVPLAFYWAKGPTFDDPTQVLQQLAYTFPIPANTPPGTSVSFHVPGNALAGSPPDTTYLLAVTDPNNALGNFNPQQNVKPLELVLSVNPLYTIADSPGIVNTWAGDYLGHSEVETIGKYGCTLTDLAMQLNAVGIPTDPGALNTELQSVPGAFVARKGGNGEVDDLDLPIATAGVIDDARKAGVSLPEKLKWADFETSDPQALRDRLLAAAQPIQVMVYNPKSDSTHYVLVTGLVGNGGDFLINDPGYANTSPFPNQPPPTRLSAYTSQPYNASKPLHGNGFQSRGYIGDPPDVSVLDLAFVTDNPNPEMIVTDPQGNIAGLVASGQAVNQIPNSFVFVEGPLENLDGPSNDDTYKEFVDIYQPVPWTYTVSMSGTAAQSLMLAAGFVAPDGTLQPQQTVSATIASLTSPYQVIIDPADVLQPLQQGTTVPPPSWLGSVASALTHSAESYSAFITAAYQRYLGRAPASSEVAAWVGLMQQGLTDEQLEAGFIGSPEYIADHGGPGAGWVTGLYQDLLGRTPSLAEVSGWVQALANGLAPTAVAYGFAAGPEREGQRVTADYQQLLGRAPSPTEVAGWVGAFEAGQATNEDVVAGFLASAEFFQAHGGDPGDWFAQAALAPGRSA
jgi:hypothetical protein